MSGTGRKIKSIKMKNLRNLPMNYNYKKILINLFPSKIFTLDSKHGIKMNQNQTFKNKELFKLFAKVIE